MSYKVSRVLHIAPTPFFADRGCHIRIRGIVVALEDLGIENLVCTYPIGRDVRGVRSVRTSRIPGYTKTEAGPSAFKYIADLLLVFTAARQIRKFRPEVLHCHLHEGVLVGWAARLLALKWRLPLVFDMQGSLTGELTAHGYFARRRFLRKVFERLEKSIVSLADLYFCSSQASADLLVTRFERDTSRVNVVRDGVDAADPSQDGPGTYPAPIGTDERTTAIYTGGLTESKGIGMLQEIFLEADRRQLPVRFVVIGYPTESLEAFVNEHGLENRCILIGQVPYEQLMRYLRFADLALEPKAGGSGEASGKVVNYMAAGLPVICFDTPNNRDMLADNGYFAKDDTFGAFVDQVAKAIGNQDEAQARGAGGVQQTLDRFSWQAGAKTIIEGYSTLRNSNAATE